MHKKILLGLAAAAVMWSCQQPVDSGSLQVAEGGANQLVNINPDPNGDPWMAGGVPAPTETARALMASVPGYQPSVVTALPEKVDNTLQPYFRPIFSQVDGSCAQAAGVGYTYTYEINRLRGLNSSVAQNQYPTHFTYNFLNGGSGNNGSWYYDGWNIINQMGVPTVAEYGGMSKAASEWVSGYGLYENAMRNPLVRYERIKVDTPEGLEFLKQWLAHHGEGSSAGGLAVFAAGAVGTWEGNDQTKKLAVGTPEAGKWAVIKWGTTMNHAMTFAGYDDTVRYDYNGDGQYTNNIDINGDGLVNMKDWEIGALIVVNSWGTSWGDGGKAYMMYKLLAEYQPYIGDGGVYNNEVFIITAKETHTPTTTLRAKIKHTDRSRLSISLGIASGADAKTPAFTQSLHAINGWRGGDFPMNGLDESPLELSLDLTSLVAKVPAGPYTVFLNMQNFDYYKTETAVVYEARVIDHAQNGRVFPGPSSAITLANYDTTTVRIVKDDSRSFSGNLPSLHFRGTPNSWGALPMKLIGENLWEVSVAFSGAADDRFKFDVLGDWSHNYGDNNADGIGDRTGADIRVTQGAGSYNIRFNDATLAYSVQKENPQCLATLVFNASGGFEDRYLTGLRAEVFKDGKSMGYWIVQNPDENHYWHFVEIGNLDYGSYEVRVRDASGSYTYSVNQTWYFSPGIRQVQVRVDVIQSYANVDGVFPTMYFRGTPNSWMGWNMARLGQDLWGIELDFANGTNERFKFDASGDWSHNYGDNNGDGLAERTGRDIPVVGGKHYRITFNDRTLQYTVGVVHR